MKNNVFVNLAPEIPLSFRVLTERAVNEKNAYIKLVFVSKYEGFTHVRIFNKPISKIVDLNKILNEL